jgi:cytochrome c oxidase assembly protein subunit 15
MQTPLRTTISNLALTQQLRRLPWVAITKTVAVLTTVGMFLVQMQGVLVTISGSAAGCGGDWPLCNGKVIPGSFTMHTAIEFGHRIVIPFVTIFVLATSAGMLAFWRKRRETVVLAAVMIVFLLLQAVLGALAVIYPTSPVILAFHYGVAIVAFASSLLSALFIFELNGWDRLRDRPLPAGFGIMAWVMMVFSYVVMYLGAYVQHRGVQLGCPDWPLCNGMVYPGFSGAAGIVFTHRLAAFLLTLGSLWLAWRGWQVRAARPDLFWGSLAALVFVLLQGAVGALVVFSRVSVVSMLLHGALVAGLFGALCYVALHVLPRPASARTPLVRGAGDGPRAGRAGTPATRTPGATAAARN